MNGHDPFELLRRVNPIVHDRVTEQDEAMLEEILAGDPRRDELGRRRRARQLVAAAVLVAAVAGTAAWAVLRSEPATDPLFVECRATASMDGDAALADATGDPISDCTPLWENGTLASTDGQVPPLTACVNDRGAAIVFPAGAEICERLGLANFGGTTDATAAARELLARLRLAFGPVCVTKDEATAIVERTLEQLGLSEWQIRYSAPFTDDRPCTAVGVEEGERVVVLGGRFAQVPAPSASVAP